MRITVKNKFQPNIQFLVVKTHRKEFLHSLKFIEIYFEADKVEEMTFYLIYKINHKITTLLFILWVIFPRREIAPHATHK